MTDILEGISVIFEKPMCDDKAKKIIDAVLQIRGILKVEPVICTSDSMMIAVRERYELHKKLLKFITPICLGRESEK
jgi:hypothetical protein